MISTSVPGGRLESCCTVTLLSWCFSGLTAGLSAGLACSLNEVVERKLTAPPVPAGKTLKHQLSNVTVQQDSSLTPGTLVLIIGSSYQGLRTSTSPSPTPTKPAVGSLAKSFNGITGDARCSSDGAAFTGPNSPPVP